MGISFSPNAYSSPFFACANAVSRAATQGLLVARDLCSDVEAYQKILLVALASIRTWNCYTGANCLPKLASVLEVAFTYDFYAFQRIPHSFAHPYSAERIDREQLVKNLKEFGFSEGDFAENCVNELFDCSDQWGAVGSAKQVQEVLKGIAKEKNALLALDFDQLQIPLKRLSTIEFFSSYALLSADLLCIPDFLHTWKLLDLSDCARAVGAPWLFSSLGESALGDAVWASLSLGFILKAYEEGSQIAYGHLDRKDRVQRTALFVAAVAESIFCLASLMRAPPHIDCLLLFVAKSAGLLPVFFKG